MSRPRTLGGAVVLSTAAVTAAMATGRTRHVVGGELANPRIRWLAIARYEDTDGVYLFYCDDEWSVVTDTWHATVAEALEQAEFEFELVSFRSPTIGFEGGLTDPSTTS